MRSSYVCLLISLFLLSKFFVFWQFDYDVSQCGYLSLSYFDFIECLLYVMCFIKFGSFSVIFLQIFFLPPFIFFLSFWDSQYMYVGILHHIPQVSEFLFSFLHPFFLLFLRLDNFNWSVFIFFDSSVLICCWAPLVKFLFHLLYFSTPVFLFDSVL